MTARQKIEGLTNAWYGYAVLVAAASLLQTRLSFFGILGAAAWFACNLAFVSFLGRRLLGRGSVTRSVLVFASGLLSVVGMFTTAKMGLSFFHTWSLSVALSAALSGVGVCMNVRSFRVLTDASVKTYVDSAG